MRNCDTLEELRARLRLLPTDLYDHFRQTLDSVEQVYEGQTARILQICLASPKPLTTLTLSVFEEPSIDYALDMYNAPWTSQQQSAREVWSVKRITARCIDLMDIVQKPNEQPRFQVHFLHRTVKDFLEEKDVHRLLLSRLKKTSDPLDALCATYLARAKIYGFESQACEHGIKMVIETARGIEVTQKRTPYRILDALDSVVVARFEGAI